MYINQVIYSCKYVALLSPLETKNAEGKNHNNTIQQLHTVDIKQRVYINM